MAVGQRQLLYSGFRMLPRPAPFKVVMAGLDKKEIFGALAKILPIATDVACFLSTQNSGSWIAARRKLVFSILTRFLYREVTSRLFIEPIRNFCVNNSKAIENCTWDLFLVCGAFCVEQAQKVIGASKLTPSL